MGNKTQNKGFKNNQNSTYKIKSSPGYTKEEIKLWHDELISFMVQHRHDPWVHDDDHRTSVVMTSIL